MATTKPSKKQSNKTQETTKMLVMYLTVKEVEYFNESEEQNETFLAYKTQLGKLNLDVKFTKDASKLAPKKSRYFEIPVDKVNLDTRGDYPVLWIRQ